MEEKSSGGGDIRSITGVIEMSSLKGWIHGSPKIPCVPGQ